MESIAREEGKKRGKQHQKVLKRPLHLQATSRKGCMRGKGGPENMSCPYKGVRQRTWGKWVAEIREPNHGARLWLGTFGTSLEAAVCFDAAARKLYGSYAKLNFPDIQVVGANAKQMGKHVSKLQNLGAQVNSPQSEMQNIPNSANETDMQEQTEDQSMVLDINDFATTGLGKLDLNLPAEFDDSSIWE